MGWMNLARAVGGDRVQCFPLIFGKTALTAGATSYDGVSGVCCKADGALVITYLGPNPGVETITFAEGEQYTFPDGANVVISSGTFHLC